MQIKFTESAQKQLAALTKPLQKKARKQFAYLLADIRHPSLDIKKYKGTDHLW